MSPTSSIPVLRGRGATVLRAEPDGLVLERPGVTLTIPVGAVARVHAEARSVTVELRAFAGATPSVHRVDEVSAAGAVAFADAVNALLPRPVEDVDGPALVDRRVLTETWLQIYRRRLGRVLAGCLGGILALAAVTAVAGDERTGVAGAVFVVPLGLMSVAGLGIGAVCVGPWVQETRRRRHGVTVVAVQDGPGAYRYTDGTGTTRVFSDRIVAPTVDVSYAVQDPSDVLVLQERSSRLLDITLGPLFALAGCGGVAFTIHLALAAIRG